MLLVHSAQNQAHERHLAAQTGAHDSDQSDGLPCGRGRAQHGLLRSLCGFGSLAAANRRAVARGRRRWGEMAGGGEIPRRSFGFCGACLIAKRYVCKKAPPWERRVKNNSTQAEKPRMHRNELAVKDISP